MFENLGTIYYTVDADTSKLVNGAKRVDGALNDVEQGFRKTDQAAARTQYQMTKVPAYPLLDGPTPRIDRSPGKQV